MTKQLDYTCGIIPVTHVDRAKDQLPATFRFQDLNGVAKGAYKHYNADKMHGLVASILCPFPNPNQNNLGYLFFTEFFVDSYIVGGESRPRSFLTY